VTQRYEEDPKLGKWVNRQRTSFRNGRMNPEQKGRLDEIGFEFYVKDKANEENWNLQFKKLCDYYGKHGHCELLLGSRPFTFILNTPTNTPPVSLPALQVKCQGITRKTPHWATGS
jgi:hypothetical protein